MPDPCSTAAAESPPELTSGSIPSLEHAAPRPPSSCRPPAGARPGSMSCAGRVDACCMVPVHIVIVGCGRVGSGLGADLVAQGHSVAIIDRNPKAFRRLPADWSGTTVIGSGFDRDDLDEAKAPEASALAAVTSGDNSNILTARIARETYGDPQRRGPHLRPPPGPDLPPARASPPWPPCRGPSTRSATSCCPSDGGDRVVRPDGQRVAHRAPPARAVGGQAAGRPVGPGRGHPGVGHPGRRRPARLRRPGRPGRATSSTSSPPARPSSASRSA